MDQKCKEVVLKEFGYCFRHYKIALEGMHVRDIYASASKVAFYST